MHYRREIDGLRTIAVLPVLFSHAGFAFFQGGFLGVDVFFVISGYLITGIIHDEIANGTFSFRRFYERRIRRILPALYVVMVASLVAGWFLMSADAYQNLGQSLFATTAFSNNILLTRTSGYWDMESSFKPLLHTWSLGVEEQYYFIVPVVILAISRYFRDRAALSMALIGAASFLACLYLYQRFPAANFYLLPTRAWELAVGGWAATIRLPERNSAALSGFGFVLVIATMVLLPEGYPTPSQITVLPVAGTVLVLMYCRSSGPVYRLLTSSPFVAVGLISYSMYLWHQPLFAFLRIASSETPPLWQFGVMIVLTIILATLSWKYIEAPFRDRSRLSFRAALWIVAPASVLLLAAGLLLHLSGGLPQRFDVAPGSEPAGSYAPYNDRVFADYKRDAFAGLSATRLLVLGNSQGRDFVNMVKAANAFVGYEVVYRDDLNLCAPARLNTAQRQLVATATLIVKVYDHVVSPECDSRVLARRSDLRGRIVFVGPKDFGVNINPVARLDMADRPSATVRLSAAAFAANRYYRSITPRELYVDLISALSPDGVRMPIYDEDGRILSEDRVHLTRAGARYVGMRIFRDPIWSGWPGVDSISGKRG